MKRLTKIGSIVSVQLAIIASGVPGDDFFAIGLGAVSTLVLFVSIFYEFT